MLCLPTVAAVLLACVMMAGCSPKTVYVPQERVVMQTDTVYSAKVRVDSVFMRDSVAVMQRGDTVFITRHRDRYRYRDRTDTVYQSVIDSVNVSVPYPVERELTPWEKVKMDAGGWAIGAGTALLVAVTALLVWLIKIKRRK